MNQDPAATLALCSWLKKRISDWEAEAKAAIGLVEGERKAAQLNGTTFAYTNKVRGRKRFTIISEAFFLDWVKHHYPGEIVESVRPSFLEKLRSSAIDRGALIDDEGEVCPYVEVEDGAPYFTTKLTDEAGIVINGLLAAGRIGVDGIRAIETIETSPEPTDRYSQDIEAGAL